MKNLYFLTILFLLGSAIEAVENCDNLGALFYQELGCKPIIEKGKECPSQFECGEYKSNPDGCNFRGRTYKKGDAIEGNLTEPSCNIGCRCDGGNKFTCAVLDCAEWLGSPIPQNCYRKYDIKHCCSIGKQCEPYDKVATCELEGKTYKEGEKFSPKNQCLSCVCQPGFKGNLNEHFCTRTTCSFELRNGQNLEQNCAPAYYDPTDNNLCCPSVFICPSSADKFAPSTKDSSSGKKCKYGKKELNLGDTFTTTYDFYGKMTSVSCKCELPPLVTCIGKY